MDGIIHHTNPYGIWAARPVSPWTAKGIWDVSTWWFGTVFLIFPYIRNNNPNWLSYFSEGWLNHHPGFVGGSYAWPTVLTPSTEADDSRIEGRKGWGNVSGSTSSIRIDKIPWRMAFAILSFRWCVKGKSMFFNLSKTSKDLWHLWHHCPSYFLWNPCSSSDLFVSYLHIWFVDLLRKKISCYHMLSHSYHVVCVGIVFTIKFLPSQLQTIWGKL